MAPLTPPSRIAGSGSERRANDTPSRNAVFSGDFSVIFRPTVSGTFEIEVKNN
jgi:hypothetical protein